MTKYFGVITSSDHIKIGGQKRPFWEFLDQHPAGWLCSLAYEREDVPADRQRIWDCGAWSYKDQVIPNLGRGRLVTPAWAMEQYRRLGQSGDLIIAPDHMLIDGLSAADLDARRAFNHESAAVFLDFARDSGMQPMAVVHGQDTAERLEHAQTLRDMGYRALALGGMAARASQKRLAVEFAESARRAVPEVWLHVLGLSAPGFMSEWGRIGIDSADGSSHFKMAFTGGAFFTHSGPQMIKHQAARVERGRPDRLLEAITAPECYCKACRTLRDEGVDTRQYGSNEHNMGRAAHNLNILIRAQAAALEAA